MSCASSAGPVTGRMRVITCAILGVTPRSFRWGRWRAVDYRRGEFHFPAPRVDVVDTTGAGDAFCRRTVVHPFPRKLLGSCPAGGSHQQCQCLRRYGGDGKRRNDRFTVSRPTQHFSFQPFAGTSHDREIRSHHALIETKYWDARWAPPPRTRWEPRRKYAPSSK